MSGTAQDLLPRHRLTTSDYHCIGEAGILQEDSRVESIEGELIDMAPIGSQHAGTVFLQPKAHLLSHQQAIGPGRCGTGAGQALHDICRGTGGNDLLEAC